MKVNLKMVKKTEEVNLFKILKFMLKMNMVMMILINFLMKHKYPIKNIKMTKNMVFNKF